MTYSVVERSSSTFACDDDLQNRRAVVVQTCGHKHLKFAAARECLRNHRREINGMCSVLGYLGHIENDRGERVNEDEGSVDPELREPEYAGMGDDGNPIWK
jgi:hypothetical protein